MARTRRSGSLFTIDLSGLKALTDGLRKTAPEVTRQLRRGLREGGEIVADDARVGFSWSTRIPRSVRVRTSGIRVSVIAGNKDAPHAAAYEHKGLPGQFRHPVFGNREVWVSERARPALRPSAERNAPRVAEKVLDAVEEVLHDVGFE